MLSTVMPRNRRPAETLALRVISPARAAEKKTKLTAAMIAWSSCGGEQAIAKGAPHDVNANRGGDGKS